LLLWIAPSAARSQTAEDQIERSFRAGQAALQQGQFDRAAEDFKKVLQLDPTLLEAQVNLGLAYQGLLEYDQATRYLAKALRERPRLLGPNVIVGMNYLKLGFPEKGIPFLETALDLDPSNRDAREALASSYMARDSFGAAAEQFRRIADLDPDKTEAWFKLGHEYLNLAARLAHRGAHLYRESPWGHRFLGDLLYERARWQDAIIEYQEALGSDPQEPGLHAAIGRAYFQDQKFDQAELEFRSELQLDPNSDQANLGLANLALVRNQPSAALDSLQRIQQVSPEFLAVQREFPWKSLEGSDPAWRGKLSNAGARDDAGPDPCRTHHYSRCIASLEARTHLTDSEWLHLGKARLALRQYRTAAEALAQVRSAAPENAEASYWLERTYQALGAEAYAQLEEQSPNSWRTHQLRAESSALLRKYQDALEEFRAALALNPNEPELHDGLGELYMETHAFDAAQGELEQTLAADPSRTHALYLLGRLYVLEGHNEKAVPYLERATRIQPDLAEANSLLGTAYLRLGQFANAVPCLEKAAPNDHSGNVHYQLFMAYRGLGRPERARKELALSQDIRKSRFELDQTLVMGSPQPESESQ
jgi:tetratricopeptide (TPR) repeat protein